MVRSSAAPLRTPRRHRRFAAGARPAAHISRRRRRGCSQVELTHRPHPPPVADKIPEGGARRHRHGCRHGGDVTPGPARRRFPRGEWPSGRQGRMIVAMNLHILTPDDAPTASRAVLDGIAADLGFVPNLAAATAASPTLLAAFDALRRTVSDETFDPVHREIAGVAVGVAVDNAYGVAFHSTVLGALGVEADDIDAMRAGSEPNDPSTLLSTPSHATSRSTAARSPTTWCVGPTTPGCPTPPFCNSSPSACSLDSSASSTTWPAGYRWTSSCSLRPGRPAETQHGAPAAHPSRACWVPRSPLCAFALLAPIAEARTDPLVHTGVEQGPDVGARRPARRAEQREEMR